MDDYIAISMLNDFDFCPYSIYLHNVYAGTDESLYHATPQTRGRIAHETIDTQRASTHTGDLMALPVYSERLRLIGKIDLYRAKERLLVERKYKLAQIFQGKIYQLWAQYLCMREMGYEVEHIAFYEISTNKMHHIATPTETDEEIFISFIDDLRHYNPATPTIINPNKCKHCIYCNLCDKTTEDNVYQ